jgi:hypothetical protein
MALATVLLRRGIRHKPASKHLLHPNTIRCMFCRQQYSLEYEPSFHVRDREVSQNLLFVIQDIVNLSHAERHLQLDTPVAFKL